MESVSTRSNERFDARFGQALGIADRPVLHTWIGGANPPIRAEGTALVWSLLLCVEHEGRGRRGRHAPAYEPTGVPIDDEGDTDATPPDRDVGEVRHPQPQSRN